MMIEWKIESSKKEDIREASDWRLTRERERLPDLSFICIGREDLKA